MGQAATAKPKPCARRHKLKCQAMKQGYGAGHLAALAALALSHSGWCGPRPPKLLLTPDRRPTRHDMAACIGLSLRARSRGFGYRQRLEANKRLLPISPLGARMKDLPLRQAASPKHSVDIQPVDILSYIISLSDLTAAIGRALRASTTPEQTRHWKRHPRHPVSTRALE